MDKLKKIATLLAGSGFIIASDQFTKNLVRTNLAFGEVWEPVETLAPFIRIVHWQNTGAAFGIFPTGGLVFTVIAVLVFIAIVYFYPQIPSEQRLLRLALMMQLGGAIGNFIDRILHGPVTDFVAVGNFPVFNVADASISVGTALLILSMWLEERRLRKDDKVEATEAVTEVEPGVG